MELYRCDKPTGVIATAAWLFPEIGQVDPDAPKQERLEQLAALFAHPENGRVPRTIVNRLWGQLMGRGIVHPLDAMGTEPWNADLLDWLAVDFQDHGYDLKRTLRLITTSKAYQSRGHEADRLDDLGNYVYSGPSPKRLTAEQFVDAIWQIGGSAPAAIDAPVARGDVEPGLEEKFSCPVPGCGVLRWIPDYLWMERRFCFVAKSTCPKEPALPVSWLLPTTPSPFI